MIFSLYFEFVKIRIMEVAEYRKAFFAGVFAQFASYGAEFILIWLVMTQFKSINNWTTYEVILLYALNLGSYAIAGFFFFNPCTQLVTMIQNGTFDEVLTKPLNHFLYLICREFNSGYLSHIILSIVVTSICFYKLGISWSLSNIIFLLVVLIGGSLIQGAGFIFTSVPAFWIIESSGLREIFFFQLRGFIKYPVSIYNNVVQLILTFLVPYAFINFYPAEFFLNKKDYLLFNPAFQFLTPFVGLILITLAYYFWKIGVNNYKSTGS